MHTFSRAKLCRRLAGLVVLWALGACSVLSPSKTPPPSFYLLERPSEVSGPVVPVPASAPTLIINPSHAAAGYDSQRMVYVRKPHTLEYYAHSEWVDPPSRMLTPLLLAALGQDAVFRAIVPTPSAATGELRLDTEIVRLQHEFLSQPSRVRFTLRAYLIDDKTRRVLAWREFDGMVAAASEDPYGGVVAANRAVQAVLHDLSVFLREAVNTPRVAR